MSDEKEPWRPDGDWRDRIMELAERMVDHLTAQQIPDFPAGPMPILIARPSSEPPAFMVETVLATAAKIFPHISVDTRGLKDVNQVEILRAEQAARLAATMCLRVKEALRAQAKAEGEDEASPSFTGV